MTRDQATEYIHNHTVEMLEKAKYDYICPACGNGSGEDGTGMYPTDEKEAHFKCPKCGMYGDIIDFWGKKEGLTTWREKFDYAYKRFGLDIDNFRGGKRNGR